MAEERRRNDRESDPHTEGHEERRSGATPETDPNDRGRGGAGQGNTPLPHVDPTRAPDTTPEADKRD